MSPGRRLRPIAALCGLLMVLWGIASAASLVVQVQDLNDLGWPDESSDGEVVAWTFLYLGAATCGCWVAMWGLFGLGWRPPLHLGTVALLLAVGLEVGGNLVQAGYIHQLDASWSFADQLRAYLDGVTGQTDPPPGISEGRLFLRSVAFVTWPVVLLWWMLVLVTGAGRKVRGVAYGRPPYGYPAQPPYTPPYPPQAYPQPYPPQAAYPQPAYPQSAYPQPQHVQPPAQPTLRYPVVPPDEQPTLELPPDR